jgi:hypothetical protein
MHCHRPPRPHGVPHRCPSCRRLLGLQTGSSLHIKRKDFEGHIVGRVQLRCRCGVTTVLATGPDLATDVSASAS